MRTLITGGAGFIGSNLCKRLLDENHEILCIDNLSTGSLKNLIPIQKDITFKQLDICNYDALSKIVIDFKPNEIYNLACPASPPQYQRLSLETLDTCYEGTKNVLRLAQKLNAKFLHTSTSEVYGDPLESPQNEDYKGNVTCIGPRACYDEGKRVAEALIYNYNNLYGVDCRIVRIFNTYGPGLNPKDGRVISNFIFQALQNNPLTIYGDGTQTRSLMYISDLLEGLIRAMDNNVFIINLGNPQEITINKLAKLVLKLIPESTSNIDYSYPTPDDPQKRIPDISRAQYELEWSPKIPLEEGLNRTIDYFKKIT